MTSELVESSFADEIFQVFFGLECGGDCGLGYLLPFGGPVDAFGPSVRLERITGEGDLWVVETVNTYEGDGDYYTCAIVEFVHGKVTRETRYYAPPLEVERS